MKTKLLLFTVLSFIFSLWSSYAQVPQGFTYQAVARDSGSPIANTSLPVRVSIMADSIGSLCLWQELHSSVTTNNSGLFTLIIGKGSRQAASTVVSFSDIDWSISPKFIKTEINYSGWKTMGVSRFWSVPYSLSTANLSGTLSKLAVKGKTAINDEALFEVKNKDGQTVFAVYNEGVRVYVSNGAKGLKGGFAVGGFGTDKGVSTPYFIVGKDSVRVYLDTNPLTKGLKGGFAVGGYDLTKGPVQNYLDVSSDSVRIYIDSNPATKKVKGGFAVGGYDMTKGPGTNYMNVNPDTSNIINPSQNRIYWYPLKNAFLTGRVLIERPDSVGTNSFASGYESKAKGKYSQALGYKAIARGDYSTAIGKNAVTRSINSFAFGEAAVASKDESYAIGREAKATGYRSFAFGSAGVDTSGKATEPPKASGDYSFALGEGSLATGKGSISIGQSVAAGDYSMSVGHGAQAQGISSISMGWGTKSNGEFSTAIGDNSTALGWGAMALAGGYSNGYNSISIGGSSSTNADYSIAIGHNAKARAMYSYAFGTARAEGMFSTAIGDGAWTTGQSSTSFGVSCGSSGQYAQSFGLYSYANGYSSLAMGERNIASGANSTALGQYTTAQSGFESVFGRYNTQYTPVSTTDWDNNDRLFVVGNGSYSIRSDAFTILKNGNTGIGTSAPVQKLEIGGTNSKIYLNSGTSNLLLYNQAGVAPPSFSVRSNGTKLVLYPNLTTTSSDFALGIDNATLWYSVPTSSAAHRFYAGTTQLFTVLGTGNVGIGVTNPTYKLHVLGGIYATSIQLGGSSIANSGSSTLYFYTNSSVRMAINYSGYVGIGTTTPTYPLHVETAAMPSSFSYGYLNLNGATGTSSGANYYSIFAQNRIRAEEFNADSDIRIKRIIGISDGEKDLQILKNVRITDFTYIDSISKGNDVHKKVIAQELKNVYPNAVTSASGFIPSIYARPVSTSFDIENHLLVITMQNEHGLKSGDNVKFIEPQGVWTEKVTLVLSPETFCVSSLKERNKLFVYGKEVNDFLTVDYEAIAMLNVSATQELISRSDHQQLQIESQQEQIDRLSNLVEEMRGTLGLSAVKTEEVNRDALQK